MLVDKDLMETYKKLLDKALLNIHDQLKEFEETTNKTYRMVELAINHDNLYQHEGILKCYDYFLSCMCKVTEGLRKLSMELYLNNVEQYDPQNMFYDLYLYCKIFCQFTEDFGSKKNDLMSNNNSVIDLEAIENEKDLKMTEMLASSGAKVVEIPEVRKIEKSLENEKSNGKENEALKAAKINEIVHIEENEDCPTVSSKCEATKFTGIPKRETTFKISSDSSLKNTSQPATSNLQSIFETSKKIDSILNSLNLLTNKDVVKDTMVAEELQEDLNVILDIENKMMLNEVFDDAKGKTFYARIRKEFQFEDKISSLVMPRTHIKGVVRCIRNVVKSEFFIFLTSDPYARTIIEIKNMQMYPNNEIKDNEIFGIRVRDRILRAVPSTRQLLRQSSKRKQRIYLIDLGDTIKVPVDYPKYKLTNELKRIKALAVPCILSSDFTGNLLSLRNKHMIFSIKDIKNSILEVVPLYPILPMVQVDYFHNLPNDLSHEILTTFKFFRKSRYSELKALFEDNSYTRPGEDRVAQVLNSIMNLMRNADYMQNVENSKTKKPIEQKVKQEDQHENLQFEDKSVLQQCPHKYQINPALNQFANQTEVENRNENEGESNQEEKTLNQIKVDIKAEDNSVDKDKVNSLNEVPSKTESNFRGKVIYKPPHKPGVPVKEEFKFEVHFENKSEKQTTVPDEDEDKVEIKTEDNNVVDNPQNEAEAESQSEAVEEAETETENNLPDETPPSPRTLLYQALYRTDMEGTTQYRFEFRGLENIAYDMMEAVNESHVDEVEQNSPEDNNDAEDKAEEYQNKTENGAKDEAVDTVLEVSPSKDADTAESFVAKSSNKNTLKDLDESADKPKDKSISKAELKPTGKTPDKSENKSLKSQDKDTPPKKDEFKSYDNIAFKPEEESVDKPQTKPDKSANKAEIKTPNKLEVKPNAKEESKAKSSNKPKDKAPDIRKIKSPDKIADKSEIESVDNEKNEAKIQEVRDENKFKKKIPQKVDLKPGAVTKKISPIKIPSKAKVKARNKTKMKAQDRSVAIAQKRLADKLKARTEMKNENNGTGNGSDDAVNEACISPELLKDCTEIKSDLNLLEKELKEIKELLDEPLSTSNPLIAAMGYNPKDDARLCRFFDPKTGGCFKGGHCKKEHTSFEPNGWTKDMTVHNQLSINVDRSLKFKVGTILKVIPTHIESPDKFYAQIVEPNKPRIDICWPKHSIPQSRMLKQPPKPYELVLVLNGENFYRAQVCCREDHHIFQVLFMDIGVRMCVPLHDIAKCDQSSSLVPPLAQLFHVHGVKNNCSTEDQLCDCIDILLQQIIDEEIEIKVLQQINDDIFIGFKGQHSNLVRQLLRQGYLKRNILANHKNTKAKN